MPGTENKNGRQTGDDDTSQECGQRLAGHFKGKKPEQEHRRQHSEPRNRVFDFVGEFVGFFECGLARCAEELLVLVNGFFAAGGVLAPTPEIEEDSQQADRHCGQ